jgi:hypothetical protein
MAGLENVFCEAGAILNEISVLYNDIMSDFDLIDANDYEWALKLIADARCAQADKYERESQNPWPGTRPQGCS